MRKHEPVASLLVLAIIIVALGVVGNMDFKAAQNSQELYCKMVADGSWPDYDGIYEKECLQEGAK